MVYIGLGKGSIIERNKARMCHVKQLSTNKKQIEILVDELIKNMQSSDTSNIRISLERLFYEEISDSCIEEIIKLSKKIDNIYIYRNIMIEKCIKNPFKGFVWNCYNIFND